MSKNSILATITAVVMSVVMVVSLSISACAAIYGDVDKDGMVTINDATFIQKYLAKLITLDDEAYKAGLVDGGTVLRISDATLIQRKLAHLIDKFPVEEQETTQETTVTDAPTTQAPTTVAPTTVAPTTIQPTTQKETVTPVSKQVTIYFTNNMKWSKVNAYFYNYASGTAKSAWPGTQMTLKETNEYGESVYTATVDTQQYDRVIFNNGTAQTTDTPVTVANSGYFILSKTSSGKYGTGVYPYGVTDEGTIKTVNLTYSTGYQKPIYIWTPSNYTPTKKYSVLYMTDGQNIFGDKQTMSGFEWECDETVLSFMKNGGDDIIIVGIDNSNNKRDSELTPMVGPISPKHKSFDNGTGDKFSKFVVDTVIPYVEKNYSTNSIRGIAGSSSGGIEAFYIGIENMDKFDYVGALSPAFLLFEDSTWQTYLSKFDFKNASNLPRIYFYSGNYNDGLEPTIYPASVAMQGWLSKLGYPDSLMKTVGDDDAYHSELFWEIYFPETLAFGLGQQ